MASNISNASDYDDSLEEAGGTYQTENYPDFQPSDFFTPADAFDYTSEGNYEGVPFGGVDAFDYTSEGNYEGVPFSSGMYPGTNINMDADPMPGGMFGDALAYTIARGAKSKALGDAVNNPHPESFWSKLFGAENVDYTDIYGGGRKGENRINQINTMRYRQAIGAKSDRTGANTGRPYQPGDFYVGQPTIFGEAKDMPREGIAGLLNTVLPFSPDRAYPEGTKRFQENLARREAGLNTFSLENIRQFLNRNNPFAPTQGGEVTGDFPRGYELAPTRPSDFEVTRPVSNVFSEGDDGGDVYSEGIFGLSPSKAREVDTVVTSEVEDFGVENPIVKANRKRMAPVTKTRVPLINPAMFDFQNMYTPEYIGNIYRAQTGL